MAFVGEKDLSRAHQKDKTKGLPRNQRIPGYGGCHVGPTVSHPLENPEEFRDCNGVSFTDSMRATMEGRQLNPITPRDLSRVDSFWDIPDSTGITPAQALKAAIESSKR